MQFTSNIVKNYGFYNRVRFKNMMEWLNAIFVFGVIGLISMCYTKKTSKRYCDLHYEQSLKNRLSNLNKILKGR